ncbi:MAG: hypothetical protein QXG03_08590, partial [Halalkalicoccus sp.]
MLAVGRALVGRLGWHGEREQHHQWRGGAPPLRRQRQKRQRQQALRDLGPRPVHPLAGNELGLRGQAPEGPDGHPRPPCRPGVHPAGGGRHLSRILDAGETAARLPYPALADSIRQVALSRRSGRIEAPPRLSVPLPEDGILLVMPASDGEVAITKLVTVHPGNAERDLPTIRGEVVVMRASTGERLGILDGGTVTARRTAALSLLAARELAPDPHGALLVVGAGAQGRAHLEAFREGLGTSHVCIVSR